MRRKEYDVKEMREVLSIIDRCDVCHIGMADENSLPYVVPMSFGYSCENNKVTFYLHCAGEGKKLDLIKQNPRVCVQMDCSHRLITGEKACNCTTEYESVIAYGAAEFVTDRNAKIAALTHLMRHYQGNRDFQFDDRMVQRTTVIKITAEQISAKQKKVPQQT
ncbi:MAG: Pyridoxamine 5'-phosphate oxidase family protein [Oscillospiraceae bacterium]|jgi:uncharacterized protein